MTTSAGRQGVASTYTVTEVDQATEPVLLVKVPGRAARADAGFDTVAPIRVLDVLGHQLPDDIQLGAQRCSRPLSTPTMIG